VLLPLANAGDAKVPISAAAVRTATTVNMVVLFISMNYMI